MNRVREEMIHVTIAEESDIVVARRRARELAIAGGFDDASLGAIVTAVSEIARNIVVHAGSGEMAFTAVRRTACRGIEVVARDAGPGIPDVFKAMGDGFSTAGGLGLGLPGARSLMDEFHLRSAAGEGTTVTMTKWAPAVSVDPALCDS